MFKVNYEIHERFLTRLSRSLESHPNRQAAVICRVHETYRASHKFLDFLLRSYIRMSFLKSFLFGTVIPTL